MPGSRVSLSHGCPQPGQEGWSSEQFLLPMLPGCTTPFSAGTRGSCALHPTPVPGSSRELSPQDSLQDLKVVINLVGSWLLGKSSLATRDPHISNVGVGSFVGIGLDESKAAERSRRTTCATLLLPYLVDGTSLAPGLGVCSLFFALQQLTC